MNDLSRTFTECTFSFNELHAATDEVAPESAFRHRPPSADQPLSGFTGDREEAFARAPSASTMIH
jgi:hypothetical protein